MLKRNAMVIGTVLLVGGGIGLLDDHDRSRPAVSVVSTWDDTDWFVHFGAPHPYPEAEQLVRKGVGIPPACFAPGTPDEVVQAYMEAFWGDEYPAVAYNLFCRWPGGNGNSAHLTWSFAPDGLFIPSGTGEPTGNSDLFARMDALFGNRATWMLRFQQSFDRYEELTGMRYTFVTDGTNDWDDGAAWGTSGGTNRGDVRIAMKNIDGNSNILAYNHFPPCSGFAYPGDMVLDRSELWSAASGSHRFLRNVVMHEHGHGLGLLHVCPTNSTKLMEPLAALNFDGLRHDDIRAVHEFYGDPFEFDNTSITANDLGTIPIGSSVELGPVPGAFVSFGSLLSIDANGEQDWFKFTTTEPADVTVTATPKGIVYDSSTQAGNGSCNSGNFINSNAMANLNIHIIDTDGSNILATGDAAGTAQVETVGTTLLTPGTYFTKIYEGSTPTGSQLYFVEVAINAPDPCFQVVCDDGNPCTDDTCVDGGCPFPPNTLPCPDAVYCNGEEVCSGGACTAGTDPCPDPSEVCDEQSQSCVPAPGACCLPDGTCDLRAAFDCTVIGGIYYGDGVACEGPLDPPCVPADTVIHCELVGTPCAAPGGTVDIRFTIEEVADMKTYQTLPEISLLSGTGSIDIDCSACTGGPNEPDCAARIDTDRPDWVFADLSPTITVVACETAMGSTALVGAATVVSPPEYLGEYTLTVSGDATPGTQFEVMASLDVDNAFLIDLDDAAIRFRPGNSCVITIPDGSQCVGPAVEAAGGRTLLVTPQCSSLEQALLVTGSAADPAVSCLSLYVQDDGTLGPDPVFHTPDLWGTIGVIGNEIIPNATYNVQADCGTPGSPDLSAPNSATMWPYGELETPPDADVSFHDINLAVAAFQGDFTNVTLEIADLHPCVPNRVINFSDINLVVQAFQGTPFSDFCTPPCP